MQHPTHRQVRDHCSGQTVASLCVLRFDPFSLFAAALEHIHAMLCRATYYNNMAETKEWRLDLSSKGDHLAGKPYINRALAIPNQRNNKTGNLPIHPSHRTRFPFQHYPAQEQFMQPTNAFSVLFLALPGTAPATPLRLQHMPRAPLNCSAPALPTCIPVPGRNICDITTSCVFSPGPGTGSVKSTGSIATSSTAANSTDGPAYCACRAGYRASANVSAAAQWRLPWRGQEGRVFVAPGTVCDTLCEGWWLGSAGCGEVRLREGCSVPLSLLERGP